MPLRVAQARASGSAMKPLYGSAFDFPVRADEPRLRYVLMTGPRSGSTYLSLALWRTQRLGAPLEYLNFDRLRRRLHVDDARAFASYWTSIKRTRTSPNGVFGVKLFANFAYAIQKERKALFHELFRDGRAIRLLRRDVVAQAVSLARARQTQRWYADDAEATTPDYDFERIAAALQRVRAFDAWWDLLAGSLRTPPLRLVYEDVVASPQAAIAAIAAHLEVDLGDAAAADVEAPLHLQPQRDALSAEWCARFRAQAPGDWRVG